MSAPLPDYHGTIPAGMRSTLSGTSNRIDAPHSIDDTVVLIVEAKVTGSGHAKGSDGIVYNESMKALDIYEVADEAAASRLIVAARAARRAADNEHADGTQLDIGPVGYTDAAGVVLTDREVASLRDDPSSALTGTEAGERYVYVTATGSRLLWPDDFADADGSPAPTLGVIYLLGDVPHLLTQRLDAETGETLAEIEPPEDPIEAYDNAPDGEVPPFDPAEEEESTEPAAEGEATVFALPSREDFEFVDRKIPELRDALEDVTDPEHLARILTAEKQGRGRGLKYRAGALDVIHARIEAVTSGVRISPEEV